nr:EamA family transporter [Chthoniobacterales bacterium]
MPEQRKFAVTAAFVALCVIWSSTWRALKWGLEDLPPISFAALRFLIAIIALLAVSIGRVPLWPRNRADWVLLGFTGVLMFAVNYGLLFWGELHVSSGLAAVLQAIIPVAGMAFAHWLLPSEPMRGQRVVGALLAVAGVALICGRLLDHGGIVTFWAGLAIVFGGAGAAFSNVLLKRRALKLAPAMIAAWQMIFGTVPL